MAKKKTKKIILGIVVCLVTVIAGWFAYIYIKTPEIDRRKKELIKITKEIGKLEDDSIKGDKKAAEKLQKKRQEYTNLEQKVRSLMEQQKKAEMDPTGEQ